MSFKPPDCERSGPFVLQDEGPRQTASGDAAAEERISAMLAEERSLDAAQVIVRVNQGQAVLSGNVLTRQEFETAAECVRAVFPDMHVENRIVAADETLEWDRSL